jgi:hypothetical protein
MSNVAETVRCLPVVARSTPTYPWESSTVTVAKLTTLVNRGLLRLRTSAREWLVPGNEVEPRLPPGYVVSFLAYHARGFAMLAHLFLREILHHFDPLVRPQQPSIDRELRRDL